MTTPTQLAETIALLAFWVEEDDDGNHVHPRNESIGEKIRAHLPALLACARRCEAIDRIRGIDFERVSQHINQLAGEGAKNDYVIRLLKLLLDSAAESLSLRSERAALAKRVEELIVDYNAAHWAGKTFSDEADRLRTELAELRLCHDEWKDEAGERHAALRKALAERNAAQEEGDRLRAENERLNSTDWIAYTNELTTMFNAAQDRVRELEALINSPTVGDFIDGTKREAAHQVERWGTEHDEGKAPEDWFWLLGYLGGKALSAAKSGDTEKALHHTISSAAMLMNWHGHLKGTQTAMRPGIAPPTEPGPITDPTISPPQK